MQATRPYANSSIASATLAISITQPLWHKPTSDKSKKGGICGTHALEELLRQASVLSVFLKEL